MQLEPKPNKYGTPASGTYIAKSLTNAAPYAALSELMLTDPNNASERRKSSFLESLTIIIAIAILCLSASAMIPTSKPPPAGQRALPAQQADIQP